MTQLYKLVENVKREGEVKAVSRLGLRVLMDAAKEGIAVARVTPTTQCSPQLLQIIKAEAEQIIGKKIFV